ncbi:MAG: hypothetical protein WC344_03150 [Bacilli bacterium]|jgi:purine-nucleoside phosphorylase
MKEKLEIILDKIHMYNTGNMSYENFGLDASVEYDALVIAPGWKPTKIIADPSFAVTTLTVHSYISGYLIEKEGLKIAWIQIASGACNLLDHMVICGELRFKKVTFVGAVGSLKKELKVGDLCTPSYSIAGVYANAYLCDRLKDYRPFDKVMPNDESYVNKVISLAKKNGCKIKKASVYCTDSIALEYSHIDEIQSFNTDLIEMETSTFYSVAALLEVPAIALLIVSDNLASGHALVGRSDELQNKYNYGRKTIIPDLIFKIAKET